MVKAFAFALLVACSAQPKPAPTGGGGGPPPPSEGSGGGEPNCICNDLFKPVCGADGKTYSNACRAKCENVEVKAEGKCAG